MVDGPKKNLHQTLIEARRISAVGAWARSLRFEDRMTDGFSIQRNDVSDLRMHLQLSMDEGMFGTDASPNAVRRIELLLV
jgi:hypothetical protein